MRSGPMRTRLVYQELQETGEDEVGQPVTSWVDLFPLWSRLAPIGSKESTWAQSVQSEVAHEVRCRYRPEIRSGGRLVVARTGAVLEIDGVRDLESLGAELSITAIQRPSPA